MTPEGAVVFPNLVTPSATVVFPESPTAAVVFPNYTDGTGPDNELVGFPIITLTSDCQEVD